MFFSKEINTQLGKMMLSFVRGFVFRIRFIDENHTAPSPAGTYLDGCVNLGGSAALDGCSSLSRWEELALRINCAEPCELRSGGWDGTLGGLLGSGIGIDLLNGNFEAEYSVEAAGSVCCLRVRVLVGTRGLLGKNAIVENSSLDCCGNVIEFRAFGTPFQVKVWGRIGSIPRGNTASYLDIAESVGEPRAMRAVAVACSANRLAVLVPCHRVTSKDGGLNGYRWGLKLRRQLLKIEGR